MHHIFYGCHIRVSLVSIIWFAYVYTYRFDHNQSTPTVAKLSAAVMHTLSVISENLRIGHIVLHASPSMRNKTVAAYIGCCVYYKCHWYCHHTLCLPAVLETRLSYIKADWAAAAYIGCCIYYKCHWYCHHTLRLPAVMWATARWKVGLLKFPLSPASDLFSTKNSIKTVSSEEVQTAPVGIAKCEGGWGGGEGTRWHPWVKVICVKMMQKGGEMLQGHAKGMEISI